MGYRLRYVPDGSLVEVTVRTIQGMFLLKPVAGWESLFVGLLGRAMERYPLQIHAFVCMSNHLHLLVSPETAHQLAAFMGHFLTNLSKEAGRIHGWSGAKFQRRYQAVVVSDEPGAQIARLRYILRHGVKEGLVLRASDWPGPHCVDALIGNQSLVGAWISRTMQFNARQRGEILSDQDASTQYELQLAPLPCWAHLPLESVRELHRELIEEIDREAAELRRVGTLSKPLGVAGVLAQDPRSAPRTLQRTPAPLIHAASHTLRRGFLRAYQEFASTFYQAMERLQLGFVDPGFPAGAFVPGQPAARTG